MDPTLPLTLTLADTVVPGGIALGTVEQIGTFSVPDLTTETVLYSLISITQPIARPVQIVDNPLGDNDIQPQDGLYPNWVIIPPDGSSLNFAAHVAAILDQDAVSEWADYRGYQLDGAFDYIRGVDMVMPTVQLGSADQNGGFLLAIALLGDLNAGADGVAVDTYNLHNNGPVPIGDPLTVDVVYTDTDDYGYVIVHVSGAVRGGHLGFFARSLDQGPGQVFSAPDSPPDLVITSAPDPTGGGVQDCTPGIPTPSFNDCVPDTPKANKCGAGVKNGQQNCNVTYTTTDKECKSIGGKVEAGTAKFKSYKGSIKLQVTTGVLTTTAGFEYGVQSSSYRHDSWAPDNMANSLPCFKLGECYQLVEFTNTCAQAYSWKRNTWRFGQYDGSVILIPCGYSYVTPEVCQQSYYSDAECCRTQ